MTQGLSQYPAIMQLLSEGCSEGLSLVGEGTLLA